MREAFHKKLKLNAANKERLEVINAIISDYKRQGYTLTLRQCYYQLVSKDIIPNNDKEYAKLSNLLVQGRMAGIVDWSAIEDRVRIPKLPYQADDVADALEDIQGAFRLDKMKGQPTYIEVWIEKDALSAILERVTREYHVRLMVNRGYSSCTAMYSAYKRIMDAYYAGAEKVKILYFGDHDPSGMDMIRDVKERVGEMLISGKGAYHIAQMNDMDAAYIEDEDGSHLSMHHLEGIFEVEQVALNMQQIRQYNPPENPAKIKDPRAAWYIKKYGNKSWELDALPPSALAKLCEDAIEENTDMNMWNEAKEDEDAQKQLLQDLIDERRKGEDDAD